MSFYFYTSQNQTFSKIFLGIRSGHLLSSASTEALPVMISASAALRHDDLFTIFQNRYRTRKMGTPMYAARKSICCQ